MGKRLGLIFTFFASLTFYSSRASAQAIVTPIVNYVTPLIFVLAAGIILAIGFQILLTVLSIASGVTLIGNVERPRHRHGSESESESAKHDQASSVIRKVTTTMGLWSVVTVSLSLFFATAFAIRLSLLAGDRWIGTALGLVIWAAFFSLVVYLEGKSATSLLGGIASTALAGFRGSIEGMKTVFAPVVERGEELAKSAVSPGDAGAGDFNAKIEELTHHIQPEGLNYVRLRGEFVDFFSDLSSRESLDEALAGIDRLTVEDIAQRMGRFSRREVRLLGKAFDDALRVCRSRRRPDRATLERTESYLGTVNAEELTTERLKQDLTNEILVKQLGSLDHGTLVSLLERRRDISHDRAEQIASDVESAVKSILTEISSRATGQMETGTGAGINQQTKARESISRFLRDLDRPPYNFLSIKDELGRIFEDPMLSAASLKKNAESFDRRALAERLEANENLSRDDAERIVSKIEQLRNKTLQTSERIEKQLKEKTETAKAAALHQAELVREATAASAWWLFATAAFSAVAAILGGWVAVQP